MPLLAIPALLAEFIVAVPITFFIAECDIAELLNGHDRARHDTLFIHFLPVEVGVRGNFNVRDPPDFDLAEKRHHVGEALIEIIRQALRPQSGEC